MVPFLLRTVCLRRWFGLHLSYPAFAFLPLRVDVVGDGFQQSQLSRKIAGVTSYHGSEHVQILGLSGGGLDSA